MNQPGVAALLPALLALSKLTLGAGSERLVAPEG